MTKELVFNLYGFTLQDVAGFTDNVLAYADTITMFFSIMKKFL